MPHTPGTWKLSHSGNANAPFVVFTGERAPRYDLQYPLVGCLWIAEVRHDESEQHEEQIANARLIAAAPELLDVADNAMSLLRELGFYRKNPNHPIWANWEKVNDKLVAKS